MADLSELRDQRQRTVGCLSVSMLVHSGLFALLILLPPSIPQNLIEVPLGSAGGNGSSKDPIDLLLSASSDATTETPEVSQAAQSAPLVEPVIAEAPAQRKSGLPQPRPQARKANKIQQVAAKTATAPSRSQTDRSGSPQSKLFDDDSSIQSALKDAREHSKQARNKSETEAEVEAEVAAEAEVDDSKEARDEILAENESPDLDAEAEAEKKKTQDKASLVSPESPAQEAPQAQNSQVAQETQAAQIAQDAQETQDAGQDNGTSSADTSSSPSSQPTSVSSSGTGPAGRSKQGYDVPLGTQQIRDASELVAQPGNRPPTYPQQDRLLGRQGTAIVVGRVQPDGTVTDVYLEKRSGSPLMDEASLTAFKKWRFMPGQQGLVRKPFQFQLSGEAVPLPARLRR